MFKFLNFYDEMFNVRAEQTSISIFIFISRKTVDKVSINRNILSIFSPGATEHTVCTTNTKRLYANY